jgi:hypothetical protein
LVRKASTYVLCLNLYKLKIDTIIYQRVYPTIREFNDDDDDFIMCERIQFVYVETKKSHSENLRRIGHVLDFGLGRLFAPQPKSLKTLLTGGTR